MLTLGGWRGVEALTAPHGVYWEALGSAGGLWEPLHEVGWSSGIGWGSIFWSGFKSWVRVWMPGLGCRSWTGV